MRQAFAPRQKCATGAHIRRVRWYIIAGMMRMTRIRLCVVLGLCCAARCGVCLAEGADGVEYGVIERQMAEFHADEAVAERLRREALEPAALIDPADRDPVDVVLRRTEALLADLRSMKGAPDLDREAAALGRLGAKVRGGVPDDANRRGLFDEVCALRRKIALKNPLLNFDDIIFLKHQRARFEHMVDQYYGFHAERAGGVFVLEDAFGPEPKARDLLTDAVVDEGRLRGRKLAGGSFISLELDFDARTVFFAWTEAEVPVPPTDYTPMGDLWTPGSTYHIFKASLDGTGLAQLTDGPWNDFDPCRLPNGRICFVSERRGGFLRCGTRPNPTYTLHSMRDNGTDIIRLSHHETHEWHPSVDNSGMIVYSRWDYVDRDSDIAHHPWITFPDGRDPRGIHGNYPAVRESRPWMELSIRAVPDSPCYAAVSTPHHGQNYGSLVLVDPRLTDDGAMAQVKRITPETAFPESELRPGVPCETHKGKNVRKAEAYGTPWPLSERYHLCVYDPGQKNYGIYLADAFGNRILLYRDPEIACLDPIPLRPRPVPPVIPSFTRQAAEDRTRPGDDTARIAIANIYESDFAWPPDTRITALRIIQLYPKTTPAMEDPNIGTGAQSLARGVLGTVPVEADGSVYCEAPAGVSLYFQALDERGRAVQSMRSDTYLHPGETLSCRGCHEPRHRAAPDAPNKTPIAMGRPPSPITPEVDGARPVLFPRLVQPVLDNNCAGCHRKEKKAPSLEGVPAGKYHWTESYETLAPLAWAKHGGNGALKVNGTSRSIAGGVGARASRLMAMLDGGHHDVKLSDGDRHRIELWLDCNSVFFGAYHDIEKQARGETVTPVLE